MLRRRGVFFTCPGNKVNRLFGMMPLKFLLFSVPEFILSGKRFLLPDTCFTQNRVKIRPAGANHAMVL